MGYVHNALLIRMQWNGKAFNTVIINSFNSA